MRCKNCGTYNDDNRYICETCGSPLYDEDDVIADDKTQTFNAVQDNTNDTPNQVEPQPSATENTPDNKDKKPNDKKSVIVISILVVVLIAIIASIIVVAQSRSKEDESTTVSTSESTTEETTEYTTEYTTERTTERTTEKATTTAPQTTEAETWYINVSSSGGGSVSGGGEFKNGDKVTLVATADSGYEFDGWYSNGIKVSNKEKYTFTANENISYSAVFNPVETTTQVEDLEGDEQL